ncbi:PREDICTED: uncharacterized protein LOC106101261 [Papilio polytes]|uniref:uncharacterized protein LOC106101261 n=1 Tax=Papilio polytes TaxID=76194 RepID=UPI00067646E1|nr:PREDICTED: uncharacterized protein LOC106101261 [Papilio polytes]
MALSTHIKDQPWYSQITNEINEFRDLLDDKITKQREQIKACKKKNELDSKFAQEIKLNSELTRQLAELNRRGSDLDRVCGNFDSLTIAESDKNRLDNDKETIQVAKELTGIRFDFSAPTNVAKGYMKNEFRRLLQPFEIENGDSETLWSLIQSTTQDWPVADKENFIPNK